MSEALQKPVEEAQQYVPEQPVAHSDETGWRQRRKRAWLWVLATPWVTVFWIHAHRNTEESRAWLGAFLGILVTDRWGVYDRWALALRRLWAHLLRDFRAMAECAHRQAEIAGRSLLIEAQQMFPLGHRVRDGTLGRST